MCSVRRFAIGMCCNFQKSARERSLVHGEQEASAYNGHFGCTCYHPLFCFNQFGDCEGSLLRPGNVHSADRWKELLEPIVARYERKTVRQYFRGDAAFAKPEIYEYLGGEGLFVCHPVPANQVLQEKIGPHRGGHVP